MAGYDLSVECSKCKKGEAVSYTRNARHEYSFQCTSCNIFGEPSYSFPKARKLWNEGKTQSSQNAKEQS